MHAQLVNDFSNADLCEAWDDLLLQSDGANAQLTREWLGSWWETFGRNSRLALVTVRDAGKITGIAPLMVTKVIGKAGAALKKLTFIGDGHTDYHDVLIADERREETVRTLVEFILRERESWDALCFQNFRGDSANLPVLREAFKDTPLTLAQRVNIQSPYISLEGTWADYYGAVGKNMRSDIRRRSNRLARMGRAEFVRLHEVDDIDGILETLKAIHVKCRQMQGGRSWYIDPRRLAFASRVLKRFGDRQWLDLVLLKLNGRVIAYYLGFAYRSKVYFWNTGFDPEFSEVSPGKLLLHHWIKDSFAQGYREFDFMVGEEPYKRQWTNAVRPNYELFVFKKTVRSRLFQCYHAYKPVLQRNRYLRAIGAGVKSRIANQPQGAL